MKKDSVNKKKNQNICDKISDIWDKNVYIRAQDLENDTDYSYTTIIKPFVVNETYRLTTVSSTILDIGCGCGYLANAIYEKERHLITAIDISNESIAYSSNKYPHIEFIHQNFFSMPKTKFYDVALAIMTITNLEDIKKFFSISNEIIKPNGTLIIVLPHPCFWPFKHIKDETFSYSEIKCYETIFATKGRNDYPRKILYFHRPLEIYLENIKNAGFKIEYCKELAENPIENFLPDILGFILKKNK